MSSLVLELQRDLYDGEKSAIELLRKAYIVARKLKVKEFEKWINAELNGYNSEDIDIPHYRNVSVSMIALNPVHGFIPVIINDANLLNLINNMQISQSISEIESLLKTCDNGMCATSKVPPELENALQPVLTGNYPLYNSVDKSQLQGIIEGIKNVILNWSLKLEEDGIVGENMSFSEKEKEKAIHSNYTINNFNGNLTNTQIQQHTQNSSQSIQNETIDLEKINKVVELIKDNIDKIELDDEDLKEVDTKLEVIEKEILKTSTEKSVIKNSLKIIGQVMEKTSVSIIASGLLYQIQQCISNIH